jgi:RsiW-degrading membrane proteinase PrsW (M82 family)
MQPSATVSAPSGRVAPPFAAVLVILTPGWSSRLAHNGVVYLSQPEVHLGLLGTNDVIFRDPHVSRLHAVIRWTLTGYEIEDLNSTGGTYVQGQRVVGRMPLESGALIRLGAVEMRFQAVGPAAISPELSATPEGVSASRVGPVPQMPAPPYLLAPHAGSHAVPYTGPYAAPSYPYPAAPTRESAWARWRRRNLPKRYWRVFLIGLLAYIAASILLSFDLNLHLVPLVIVLASALVPITFVVFCWEEGAFADMPATVVALTFVSGAILGLLVAAFLEDFLLFNVKVIGPITVGIIEEGAKALAVVWFLRDRRLRSELDGLVLGAAAGMGFATFETAGYGFSAFLGGYTQSLVAGLQHLTPSQTISPQLLLTPAFAAGVASMTLSLVLRMVLAVFGHGAWTAIVCAAIWRERGPAVLRITWGVVLAFGIAVTLHAMWDSVGSFPPYSLLLLPLSAVASLWILRFFIHEAVDRAKLGSLAPPPAPLWQALGTYLAHPRRRPTVQPYPAAVAPVGAPAGPLPARRPMPPMSPMPPMAPVAPAQYGPGAYGAPPYTPAAYPPPPGAYAPPLGNPPAPRPFPPSPGAVPVSSGSAPELPPSQYAGLPAGPPGYLSPRATGTVPLAREAETTSPADRICPNGHRVIELGRSACPQCGAPLSGG